MTLEQRNEFFHQNYLGKSLISLISFIPFKNFFQITLKVFNFVDTNFHEH